MSRMKRAMLVLALAGCSTPMHEVSKVPGERSRREGVYFTGDPQGKTVVACDRLGRWSSGGFAVDHRLEVPSENAVISPENGEPVVRNFRETLPLPVFHWGAREFEITQLLYPAGSGFVAQYCLMNHGSETRTCRLLVDVQGDPGSVTAVTPPKARSGSRLTYEFTIATGGSAFVFLSAGSVPQPVTYELADQAALRWETALGARKLVVPDPAFMAAYSSDLAGSILGIKGCDEALERHHQRIAKREGDALRLFPDAPEAWLLQEIQAQDLPTPFGLLTLTHQGAYNTRSLVLGGACKPPGGFLLALSKDLKAAADGRPLETKDGSIRIPAGTKRMETSR
jgi:hypothetical protein